MKYFRNTELATLYKVSEKSVRNWVESAKQSKLDLQIEEVNGKFYVSNTVRNTHLIESLVSKGRKYKNTRGFRNLTPTPEFYKLYTHKQILDIISNLTIHHEIPLQYSYVNGGATYWNTYSNRLMSEESPNILSATIDLLDLSAGNIDRLTANRKQVNVVDLGPGNGLPIRATLARLLKQGRLKRYIAVDDSKDMLRILEENIKEWFGDQVQFEGYVRDFSYERFDDLLADEKIGDDADVPANLVFFLGGTLSNFRYPDRILQSINSSLGINDLLFYSGYLDTPQNRRYFDFDVSGLNQSLSEQERLILDLLSIDETLYDVEQVFDEKTFARSISALPKIDLSITFRLSNGERSIELDKNEPILLWRHWHMDAVQRINQFDRGGFDVIQATKSSDGEFILITSKIKTGLNS